MASNVQQDEQELMNLPPEIIQRIATYLKTVDLINFGLCSKNCKDFVKDILR